MKEEYFKTGQLWTSEEYPERDVFITDTCNMYGDNNDNSKHVLWQIANEEAWTKFVCEKLNVSSIDEAVYKRNNGTYPYEYGGEKTFKSMKVYIKKWNLELKENDICV